MNSKLKILNIILISFLISTTLIEIKFLPDHTMKNNKDEKKDQIENSDYLKTNYSFFSLSPRSHSVHSPIFINGSNWSICDAVTGKGTVEDPYTISNLIIDADGKTGLNIYNSSSYAIIKNCTIWNGYTGIRLTDSSNINLTDNIVFGNQYHGLDMFFASNCNLQRNIAINNSRNGFNIVGRTSYREFLPLHLIPDHFINYNDSDRIFHPSNNKFIENTAQGNLYHGFDIQFSSICELSNNLINNNTQFGISFVESVDNSIFNNNIMSNKKGGIRIFDSINNTIIENNVNNNGINDQNWGGISIESSRICLILNNYVEKNNGNGISIDSQYCTVSGNWVLNNTRDGIYLLFSTKCSISRNNITQNELNGIHLRDIINCSILENYISDNYNYAINLEGYVNMTIITENWILNNKKGDIQGEGNNNDIHGNIIQSYRRILGYSGMFICLSIGISMFLIVLSKHRKIGS